MPLLVRRIGEESANARKLSRRRRRAEAARPAIGEKGAEVGGAKIEQTRRRDLLPAISPQELD